MTPTAQEFADLVTLLRTLEWAGEFRCCPACRGHQDDVMRGSKPPGHKPDCALAAALARATK